MTQDGGTRDGTFHGEIDRCRESQGWTTACGSRPERDGKGQIRRGQPRTNGFVLVRLP